MLPAHNAKEKSMSDETVGTEVQGNEDAVMKGAFVASLARNNKQIRTDRAQAIAEDAEMTYGRAVQDLEVAIKRMKREREGMLDLSPTNAFSLMVANDFDSAKFVARDVELGIEIRNAEIKLEIMRSRYAHLFQVGE
jgi:hypothetical protein